MQAEYFPEIKATTQHPCQPPMVVVTIDRAEAMKLISKLAVGLEASHVTRDRVEWNPPPAICLPIVVNDKFFAEAHICIDITKGYLNGDDLKEEDHKKNKD